MSDIGPSTPSWRWRIWPLWRSSWRSTARSPAGGDKSTAPGGGTEKVLVVLNERVRLTGQPQTGKEVWDSVPAHQAQIYVNVAEHRSTATLLESSMQQKRAGGTISAAVRQRRFIRHDKQVFPADMGIRRPPRLRSAPHECSACRPTSLRTGKEVRVDHYRGDIAPRAAAESPDSRERNPRRSDPHDLTCRLKGAGAKREEGCSGRSTFKDGDVMHFRFNV